MSKFSYETPEFLDLVKKPEFKEEVSKLHSLEDLKNLFSKNGLDMTNEDLVSFVQSIQLANGELNDEMLENIAGGSNISEAVGEFIKKHPWLVFWDYRRHNYIISRNDKSL